MTVLENLMVVPGSQSGERILIHGLKEKLLKKKNQLLERKQLKL